MKTVQEVINEADILVPNVLSNAQKVEQLNNITNEFYNNVKIPNSISFPMPTNSAIVPANDIKEKDIEVVQIGFLNYRDNNKAGTFNTGNRFTFDDNSKVLTVYPRYPKEEQCIIRYYKSKSKIYRTSLINEEIDAPVEFQQSFVSALAAWIALTQDDIAKSSVYESQYRSVWNAASQNYGGAGQ